MRRSKNSPRKFPGSLPVGLRAPFHHSYISSTEARNWTCLTTIQALIFQLSQWSHSFTTRYYSLHARTNRSQCCCVNLSFSLVAFAFCPSGFFFSSVPCPHPVFVNLFDSQYIYCYTACSCFSQRTSFASIYLVVYMANLLRQLIVYMGTILLLLSRLFPPLFPFPICPNCDALSINPKVCGEDGDCDAASCCQEDSTCSSKSTEPQSCRI